MRLVLGRDFEVAQWAFRKLGHNIEPPFTAIGFSGSGGIEVAAVFNDYVPGGNVELTMVAERPFTRFMLGVIAEYAFRQWGCARLSVKTKRDNARVISIARRAGFVREATLKDYYGPGENAELFRMLKKDCRWLR